MLNKSKFIDCSQEEKLTAIRQFAIGLTDQMSNLLVVISGRLNILQKRKIIKKDVKKDLESINICVSKLSKIISRIQKFANDTHYRFENLNVNEVIESAVTLLAYHKECSPDVNIKKDLFKGIPFTKGDFKQLQEVFLNLFLNAYQAMPKGGELVIKTLNFRNQYLEIRISDTGCRKAQEPDFELLFCHKVINNFNGRMDIREQGPYGRLLAIKLPVVQ